MHEPGQREEREDDRVQRSGGWQEGDRESRGTVGLPCSVDTWILGGDVTMRILKKLSVGYVVRLPLAAHRWRSTFLFTAAGFSNLSARSLTHLPQKLGVCFLSPGMWACCKLESSRSTASCLRRPCRRDCHRRRPASSHQAGLRMNDPSDGSCPHPAFKLTQ